MHRSVTSTEHLGEAQEEEAGGELGNLRNRNGQVVLVAEKQLLFESSFYNKKAGLNVWLVLFLKSTGWCKQEEQTGRCSVGCRGVEGSDGSCVWLSYFSLGQSLQHGCDVPAVRYPLLFLSFCLLWHIASLLVSPVSRK